MKSTMTTQRASSARGFLKAGPSLTDNPRSNPVQLFVLDAFNGRPLAIPNTRSLDDVITEAELDPEKAQFLAAARQNMAAAAYSDEPETLTFLRLAAGLSQSRLAAKAGTSQPYIAKLEKGNADPSTEMIGRMAIALGYEEDIVFRAIRNQRKTRGS